MKEADGSGHLKKPNKRETGHCWESGTMALASAYAHRDRAYLLSAFFRRRYALDLLFLQVSEKR